jgi:monolysocardiolipin acyltransferase
MSPRDALRTGSGPALLSAGEQAALARFRPANTVYSRAMIGAVTWLSRHVMTRRNTLHIEGQGSFDAVRTRALRGGSGLLTFSNHVSLFDDPLLVACFGPTKYDELRWVGADALNFFGGPVRASIFGAGKCVPIVRGAGVDQLGLAFLRERLRAGDWVHYFPEGGRTRDPAARLRASLKSGIGRLVVDASPVALAFVHAGMENVLPIGARFPKKGQTVRLRFGAPVVCGPDFLRSLGAGPGGGGEERVAAWAQETLSALQSQLLASARE